MDAKVDQISRYGAYGVLLQEGEILLTLKKSGPYLGLWDLPGGGIEFGETASKTMDNYTHVQRRQPSSFVGELTYRNHTDTPREL